MWPLLPKDKGPLLSIFVEEAEISASFFFVQFVGFRGKKYPFSPKNVKNLHGSKNGRTFALLFRREVSVVIWEFQRYQWP